MNFEFVGRHVQVDERIRSHAQEKLATVAKFLKEPIEVHVTLDAEKNRQIAELRIAHRHGSLHSREENHDLLEAVGLAIDAVEDGRYQAILLGYALCNNGIRGLRCPLPLVIKALRHV